MTFLGGAVDQLDKQKSCQMWQTILSRQVPGQIKNVYTKRDLILLLYTLAESDWALGRNATFDGKVVGARNFSYDKLNQQVVSDEVCFAFKNYDL